ncbi:MAG TPA: hypothetical protein VGF45_23560 [Polyangia bacterium]
MTKRLWSKISVACLVALAGFASARTAQAYPQWQFSSGTARCSQCHFSPSGGGIVTGYGRDAVGDDLSTWEGDGSFAHGSIDLPKAVALQFDGRYAGLLHDAGETRGPRQLHFPMQADLSLRFAVTDEVSFVGTVGYRGQARASDFPLGRGAAVADGSSRFISREHYLMWRPAPQGAYVRAGRFFAPFGLRMAEHNLYVRRDLGFNLLEESYNLSAGYVQADWEVHLTAFGPDFLRKMGGDETGGAGMFEWRFADMSALGLQARLGMKNDRNRYTGGVFGKTFLEGAKLLIQAELNLVHTIVANKIAATNGFVGYAGITYFAGRGFWITPFGERAQTSIQVRDTATNAGGLQLNWFPYPHFELVFQGRVQMPTGQDQVKSGLLFAHYYL